MEERIPVIDISPFLAGSADGKSKVAEQFDQAFSEVGFAVITGHGIPEELPDRVFETARNFFDLPLEQKLLVQKAPGPYPEGYRPFATTSAALSMGQVTPEDLRESFAFARPDRHSAPYNKWPERPAGLQDTALSYYYEMEALAVSVLRIIATALGLPEDYFADKVNKHDSAMAFHHYPPPLTPPLPGQLRIGAHTDSNLMTLLRTEREHRPGGLQARSRSGNWIDIPAIPNSFILNIGDIIMRWTNDKWISTLHRVVNPPLEAGEASRRISVPFFFCANDDAVIECLPSCCSSDNPPKFKPVIAGEWMRARFAKSYGVLKLKAEGKINTLDTPPELSRFLETSQPG